MIKATGEQAVEIILGGHGVKLDREYRFNSARKWRFDFAIVDYKIAIEVEGGTWGTSRHTTGAGYRNDCTKYNSAACLGWKVLRYTTDMIRDNPGQILNDVLLIIEQKNLSESA